MDETELETARRHAAEGRLRIARQRALVVKLVARGQDRTARPARRRLAAMLETQRRAEEHVVCLERDAD